jgi:thiamine biosynthesis lipoprotein
MGSPPRPLPLSPAPASLSFEALGGVATVATTVAGELDAAVAVVKAEVRAIDVTASRFRADSEIERLNARAGEPVTVSPLLLDAIAVAIRAAHASDGSVDPTLGAVLIAAGYDRDFQELERPSPTALGPPAPRILQLYRTEAWRLIELDREAATVLVPRGVRLDLGATAKALAADRAAAAAASRCTCGVLVSLSGDIATGGEPPTGGWSIHVSDDHRAPAFAPGQTVAINSGGLATSSSTARRWLHDGHNMHHIIDPRSASPARSIWRTVSVSAASCVDANTASTAALVLGRRAQPWLERIGLPARLVGHDGEAVIVGGWPSGDEAAPQAG